MTLDEAIALLEGLGKTADEVADSLKAQGIKGEPGSACYCPLANFLRSKGAPEPGVIHGWFRVHPHPAECGAEAIRVPLPKGADAFLRAFDCDRYPDLAISDG